MVYSSNNQQSVPRRNMERTYNIDLDIASKKHLQSLMVQELHYYNTLITELNSKLRVLYNEIISLKDSYEKIWINVAQTGVDLRTLVKKPITEWPEVFKPYVNQIINNGKLAISDRMMMLMDIAATKSNIDPQIRKAMASEIIKYIQPQAKQIDELNSNLSGQMKNPIQMLQPKEFEFKRHVQLTSDIVNIKYDQNDESSTIKIPYIQTPIKIEDYDLTKQPYGHMVIRQRPGSIPNKDTPWQITLTESNERYMLGLTDMSYMNKKRKDR